MAARALPRLAALLLLTLGLAACETAEGFVQDSENVGEAIADGI